MKIETYQGFTNPNTGKYEPGETWLMLSGEERGALRAAQSVLHDLMRRLPETYESRVDAKLADSHIEDLLALGEWKI